MCDTFSHNYLMVLKCLLKTSIFIVLFALILLGTAETGRYFILPTPDMNDAALININGYNISLICKYDTVFGIFTCCTYGIIYWGILLVNFSFFAIFYIIPVYFYLSHLTKHQITCWMYNTTYKIICFQIFSCSLCLVFCFVGVELLGLCATYIITYTTKSNWINSTCNLNSYFGLMNFMCNLWGWFFSVFVTICISICIGLYKCITCTYFYYKNDMYIYDRPKIENMRNIQEEI